MTKPAEVRGLNDKHWGTVVVDDATGTKLFITQRGLNHFCWKYRGYGVQYELFEAMQSAGVDAIIIVAPDAYFMSKLETWDKKGVIDTLRFEDGEQIFLPVDMQEKVSLRVS